jgi:phosphomannomutase
LGQKAPLDEKKKWDPDFSKRKKIKAILDPLIPEFSVRLGGATSIDVTKPASTRPTAFENCGTCFTSRSIR